ncbi:MAG TPA: helix-turn-helix domain-containing protein [Gemmatimonadaceae bacterium]|nr:helix-turn-helix domain-containing protein [Gemmatimonadaceae bacterium]
MTLDIENDIVDIMPDIDAVARLLIQARRSAGMSQRELAARAKTTQAAVARIERGQTSPTLNTLARLINAAGFDLHIELAAPQQTDAIIEAYKRDIDRSLLRENLKKTVDQRVRSLTALARFAREARRAGHAARQAARTTR